MTAGKVRIGVSGWRYTPWRGHFYPPGLAQSRLHAGEPAKPGQLHVVIDEGGHGGGKTLLEAIDPVFVQSLVTAILTGLGAPATVSQATIDAGYQAWVIDRPITGPTGRPIARA